MGVNVESAPPRRRLWVLGRFAIEELGRVGPDRGGTPRLCLNIQTGPLFVCGTRGPLSAPKTVKITCFCQFFGGGKLPGELRCVRSQVGFGQGECDMSHGFLARVLFVLFAGLFVASRSSGQALDSNLDPFQEVPPHNTPGYGSADLTLNVGTSTISINASTGIYADLLAGATTVRLQDAAVGANGPTIGSFNLDTPGNTSGTFSGSIASLTNAQITDILAGNTYINIADSVFPSGEIRGQVLAVPEPCSMAIVGGVGFLMLNRRRPRA
jgi:CHRD domain-containing protein